MHQRLFALSLLLGTAFFATLLIHSPSSSSAAKTQTNYYFLPQIANDFCGPFLDPFNDESPRWFTGNVDGLQAGIVEGEYRLAFSGRGAVWLVPGPICPREAYRATVDARWAGAGGNFIGLLFGIDDPSGRAYLFAVNTDTRVWLVFEVSDGDLDVVIAPTAHDAVQPGNAVNRLSAARAGDRIVLSVNDMPVGELTAVPPGAPVLAGVAAASYTTQSSAEARFDNFFWSDE